MPVFGLLAWRGSEITSTGRTARRRTVSLLTSPFRHHKCKFGWLTFNTHLLTNPKITKKTKQFSFLQIMCVSLILANPRALKHLCRLKIRQCMGRLRLRCPVFMSFLPLPNRLKAYVLYKEYDLYGQGIFTGTW